VGDEFFDEGGVFVVDGDELDMCGVDRGLQLVEGGDLGDTGGAPCGPELEDDDFAFESGELCLSAVGGLEEVIEGQCGGGPAGRDVLG